MYWGMPGTKVTPSVLKMNRTMDLSKKVDLAIGAFFKSHNNQNEVVGKT